MLESSHIYCIDKFCQVTYQFNIPCFLKFYCFLLDFLLFLHSESWANWTFWWILPFFILFIFSHSVILQVSTKRQHSVLCWFPLHEGIEWVWIPLLCPHSGSGLLPDAVGWGEQGELKIKGGELFSGCRGALQNCSLCWASLRLSKAQDGWTHPSSSALLWKWHRVVTSLSISDKSKGVMLVPALQGALHGGCEVGDPQGDAPEPRVLQEWNPLCWVPDLQQQQQLLHREYPHRAQLCPAVTSPELSLQREQQSASQKKSSVWVCGVCLAQLWPISLLKMSSKPSTGGCPAPPGSFTES